MAKGVSEIMGAYLGRGMHLIMQFGKSLVFGTEAAFARARGHAVIGTAYIIDRQTDRHTDRTDRDNVDERERGYREEIDR